MAHFSIDECTRIFWLKGILDVDRDALPHRRLHGSGEDHFRSEMRQLHRLVVAELGNGKRGVNQLRVRSQHPGHVSPNLEILGFKGTCKDGSSIIRSGAAQRGSFAFGRRSDKTSDHFYSVIF